MISIIFFYKKSFYFFSGLGYNQMKDRLPHDIEVACRNSDSSCTISGPIDSVNNFVEQLKSEGIFAKSVNVGGIAFHSRYIQPAGPVLLKYLKDVSFNRYRKVQSRI